MNVKLFITLKSIDRLAFSSNGRCVLCTSQFYENYFSIQFIEVKMGGEWGMNGGKGAVLVFVSQTRKEAKSRQNEMSALNFRFVEA